jgi:ubiquinone/menaquinone biosynthesis C-methylase UbiE
MTKYEAETLPTIGQVRAIYDRAYAAPGLMGTHLDLEYSQFTKTQLLRMCKADSSSRLLDLGAGDGDLWQFAPETEAGFAIDLSGVGIARTTQRFPWVRGTVALSERLPFPDHSFDAVVAADTIEHVFDIHEALEEIRRVLAPGGRIAVSVPTPQSLRTWAVNHFIRQRPSLRLALLLVKTVIRRQLLFGRAAFQPIDRDFKAETWRALLVQHGFYVREIMEWPTEPQQPIVILIGAGLANVNGISL